MKKKLSKTLCVIMSSVMIIMSLSLQVFAESSNEYWAPGMTPNVLYTTDEYNLSSRSNPAVGADSFLSINHTYSELSSALVTSDTRTLLIVMMEADLFNEDDTVKTYIFGFDGRRLGDYMIFLNTEGAIEDTPHVELYLTMQLSHVEGDSGATDSFFTYHVEQK